VPAERIDVLGRKRENAIPHGRVKQMIAKRERAVIAEVAKAFGISKAEAELKLEDLTGHATEHSGRMTSYEQRLQEVQAVEAVIAADPDRFISMLAMANPAYQKFAAVLQQAASQAHTDPRTQGDEDPEPQPDYDLGNGQFTYSLDGLKQRDAWKERQLEKKLDQRWNDRLKPFEEDRKSAQERQRLQEIHSQATERVSQQMEKAYKWPGFKEHEADILKALQADPSISLHDAYMSVYMPKLAGDRSKMREEILAEINKKPRSSSAPTSPVIAGQETPKAKTTEDIAREVMAQFAQ
jgi:hypothetical protein